ncbi:ubiquitin domain-containing protein DSK2b [Capsicum annuum]
MYEMMHNTDRAMNHNESSPEGFNMLRHVYENVQDHFLIATTMGGDGRSDVSSNPLAMLLGAQGVRQGREQSTNPQSTSSEATANTPAPNTIPLPNPWATAGKWGITVVAGLHVLTIPPVPSTSHNEYNGTIRSNAAGKRGHHPLLA